MDMGAPRITDLTPLGRGQGAGRPSGDSQKRPLTARGRVAVAPASTSADMAVTFEWRGRDIGEVIPAGSWDARSDGSLPAVGDACLVVYDDLGDAWVPIWSNA